MTTRIKEKRIKVDKNNYKKYIKYLLIDNLERTSYVNLSRVLKKYEQELLNYTPLVYKSSGLNDWCAGIKKAILKTDDACLYNNKYFKSKINNYKWYLINAVDYFYIYI